MMQTEHKRYCGTRRFYSCHQSVFAHDLHRVSLINPFLGRKKEGERLNSEGLTFTKIDMTLSLFYMKFNPVLPKRKPNQTIEKQTLNTFFNSTVENGYTEFSKEAQLRLLLSFKFSGKAEFYF